MQNHQQLSLQSLLATSSHRLIPTNSRHNADKKNCLLILPCHTLDNMTWKPPGSFLTTLGIAFLSAANNHAWASITNILHGLEIIL
jgi:hypothetical protein